MNFDSNFLIILEEYVTLEYQIVWSALIYTNIRTLRWLWYDCENLIFETVNSF